MIAVLMETEPPVPVKIAAELCGVPQRRILAAISRGALEATKVHGRWVIDLDDLADWHLALASRDIYTLERREAIREAFERTMTARST